MATKRKTTTAIVAGATAVALLLGGTFAWTSISQTAKNETAGIVNVGGRLHDDFDGNNKDVYVENFTDPLNGGQPIYARIKLTEYMEVGSEAGQADKDDRKATPVVNGTDINDKDNWPVHVPAEYCNTCKTGETCLIHDHWEWTMGGDDAENNPNGQTVFMPTFNKDKDSLAADINGTYHGTDDTDKIYYDNYVEYTTDANGKVFVAGTDTLPYTDKIYQKTDTAYYDDDTNTAENDHANGEGVRTETETHTAKQTATASVMTMQAWIDGGKVPGNYWVYDTDGWAYWANPIMPGEATGLLLDGIKMTSNPGEKCYYAINVVAEFATVGDWEYFTGINKEDNANALELLEAASNNVTTVTVTNGGATILYTVPDATDTSITNTTNFTATASKPSDSTATVADPEFTWAVYDADLNPVTTSNITADGVLTVGEGETNKNLIIVATHTESGAVGLATVAVIKSIQNLELTTDGSNTVTAVIGEAVRITDGTSGDDIRVYYITWGPTGPDSNWGQIEMELETSQYTYKDGILTITDDSLVDQTIIVEHGDGKGSIIIQSAS